MKYACTLIAVRDIEKSKQFYSEVLGLNTADDFGANVTLQGGIALQSLDIWAGFIHNKDIAFKNNSCELYFEEDDIDAFIEKLDGIHSIE